MKFSEELSKLYKDSRTPLIKGVKESLKLKLMGSARNGYDKCAFVRNKYSYSEVESVHQILGRLTDQEIIQIKEYIESELGLRTKTIEEIFESGRRGEKKDVHGFIVYII